MYIGKILNFLERDIISLYLASNPSDISSIAENIKFWHYQLQDLNYKNLDFEIEQALLYAYQNSFTLGG